MESLPKINDQLTAKNLFDAFKTQLAKDFEQSEFSTDFINALEPDYDHIHKKITSELLRSEAKNNSLVMRLLNRIDISELQLKKYLSENRNEDRFNVIAELIIKRVLQKVVIKQHYKKQ